MNQGCHCHDDENLYQHTLSIMAKLPIPNHMCDGPRGALSLVHDDLACADISARLVFILSLSTLLTAAVHRPDTLRGLSRWTLSFVMRGPNAGFWRRKRLGTNAPPTPAPPTREPTPPAEESDAQNTL